MTVLHVPDTPVFDSILNPVIGSLPLFDGAIQEIFTVLAEISVAFMPVGGSGNAWFCCGVVGCEGVWPESGADDVLVGITETVGEGFVCDPPANIAVTEKLYVLFVVRFGTV